MTPFLIGPGSVRYSSIRASNGKYILVQGDHGYNNLHDIDGKFIRQLPAALSHSAQVVFSKTERDTLYYCAENCLMRYEIDRRRTIVEHEFPEYSRLVSSHAEGDLSEDGDHLALCGLCPNGNEEVFVYSLSGGKGVVYPQPGAFDGLKVAGSHPILSSESGIYDLETNQRLTSVNGHGCIALIDGFYSLLWCTSDDSVQDSNSVKRIDLGTGLAAVINEFDWAYAMHISAGKDSAIVSVYDPTASKPSQIWSIAYDGSSAKLLYEWHSPYNADYQPRATYSDGLILFNKWNGGASEVWALKLGGVPVQKRRFIEYPPGKEYPIVTQAKCPACGSTIAGIGEYF